MLGLLSLASYYSGSGYGSSYGSGYSSYSSYSPYSYSSSSSFDVDDLEEVFEALAPFMGIIIIVAIVAGIIGLVVGILTIVSQWKVFTKAGRKGWECLIPYHSTFVLYDMSNVNPAFILILLFGGLVPVVGSFAVLIASIILAFYVNIKLAQSFGRSAGFGVGLALLGWIFWPILGLGKSEYQGTFYTSQSHDKAPATK